MRSPLNKYCFLRYSHELHAAIKFKIDQKRLEGITIAKIAEEVEIDRTRISKYYNETVRKAITQADLLRLANYLGIEIELNVKIV